MINFNEYLNNKSGRNYNGTSNIKGILINNSAYLLKFQSKIEDYKENETSYRNNVISEYLACKIIKLFNYPVQDVILGNIKINEKNSLAVACKDFTNSNEVLYDFKDTRSPFLEEKSKYPFKNLELNEILINVNNLSYNGFNKEELIKRFWEQFVIDAFIGNYDRHNGNWGYILNKSTNEVRIAPIYDCGASFDSKLSKEFIEKYNNDYTKLKNHVLNDQKSIIQINGKNIIYYDFFINSNYKDFYEALNNIFLKINMNDIYKLINETEGIDDIHKEYYKKMLDIKYEHLLEKTYKRINNNINLLSSDIIKEKNYKILNEEKNSNIKDTIINHKDFGGKSR